MRLRDTLQINTEATRELKARGHYLDKAQVQRLAQPALVQAGVLDKAWRPLWVDCTCNTYHTGHHPQVLSGIVEHVAFPGW
ncbi:MAG: hypothetical protein GY772_03520, partial [bacterium]|nr:hypothetical protein [bacterium]